MMAEIMSGAPVAALITERLSQRLPALLAQGVTPRLAIVRVGGDGGKTAYERSAKKRCEALGLSAVSFVLPEDVGQGELMELIARINRDDAIHGCILLRPLPPQLDEDAACEALLPEKDVDGVTSMSLFSVFSARKGGFAPCTAQACMELLDYYGCTFRGLRAAVIGRSLVVGRPLAMLLQARDATVTMCHSKTTGLARICREQDIIVVAAGHAGLINRSFVAPGQTKVDVGINVGSDGRLCGDVELASVEPIVRAVSPVPGGVGAITTAMLASHLVQAASARLK